MPVTLPVSISHNLMMHLNYFFYDFFIKEMYSYIVIFYFITHLYCISYQC